MPEFARVSRIEVANGRTEDALHFFGETDLEGAAAAPGFRTAFWLLDRESGKGLEMVVFESREALEAAEQEEHEARGEADSAGVDLGAEEIYEVVAEVREDTREQTTG